MIPAVTEHSDELKRICLRYSVQRLDLFGSAATGEHHLEGSDLDFVVEFQPTAFASYADAYFGLLESLVRSRANKHITPPHLRVCAYSRKRYIKSTGLFS